jgi:hypothetical protein
MSFSPFSSFLQKLTFQCFKSQLKNLPFISTFDFSAFWLKKPAEKQKQTGPKCGATGVPPASTDKGESCYVSGHVVNLVGSPSSLEEEPTPLKHHRR